MLNLLHFAQVHASILQEHYFCKCIFSFILLLNNQLQILHYFFVIYYGLFIMFLFEAFLISAEKEVFVVVKTRYMMYGLTVILRTKKKKVINE